MLNELKKIKNNNQIGISGVSNYIMNDEDLGVSYTYRSYSDHILKKREVHTTRKEFECAACNKKIKSGSKAIYYCGVSARRFYTYYICAVCENC